MTTDTRRRRSDLAIAVAVNLLVVLAFASTMLGGRSAAMATDDPSSAGPPASLEVLATQDD